MLSAEMVPPMWEPFPLTRGSFLLGRFLSPIHSAQGRPLLGPPRHTTPRQNHATARHTIPRRAMPTPTRPPTPKSRHATRHHTTPRHTAPQHWKDQRWIWWDILSPSEPACLAKEQVLWWHLALTKVSLKFGILLTSPERLNDKCPFSCQCRGGFPSPS